MIRVERLRKAWPDFALEIEQLEIGAGEYYVVLGPSGAGKTALLLCLAGILRADSGRIWFGERDVTDLAPEHRSVGWVSQWNTLFPHLTVVQNIRFGRRYCRGDGRGREAAEQFDRRVARLVEMLDLVRLLDRLPADLSGGEAQRVMLARALAREPRVLLLDEPLRGLDPATQERLRDELRQVHREMATTTLHITHDHVEARALAERIAILRDGRIEQIGRSDDVFERPTTPFVARFTGAENLFLLSGREASAAEGTVQILDRGLLPDGVIGAGATHIAVRPEHVAIRPIDEPSVNGTNGGTAVGDLPSGSFCFKATIESQAQHGAWLRVTVRSDVGRWVALVQPRTARAIPLAPGSRVAIAIAPEHVCVLKRVRKADE
ncbi:ABC transporter ATP-binding protein [Candidatus Sumerlaeota bacterium]|nr:ABC transporter ATP-binding protein [Candidatus Sumerlaeota bacterium]